MIERRAIGWRLPAVLGLIVVVDQLVSLGALGVAPRTAAPLGPRLLGGLVTVGVLSVVLAVARGTWLRSGVAQARAWIGVATVALAVQVGLTVSRRTLVARGIIPDRIGVPFDEFVFLSGTTLVVLLVLGALHRHRALMVGIADARSGLEAAYVASTSGLVAERGRLAERVRELLEQRLGPTSMRPALFTAERLRSLADDVLRPLSHQLATTSGDRDRPFTVPSPRAHLGAVLRSLRPVPVLRPRLLAATMFLLTFRFSVTPPPAELLGDPAPPPAAGPSSGPDVTLTVEWSSLIESLVLHATTVLIVLVGTRILARWLRGRTLADPRGETTLLRDWTVTSLALTILALVSLALLRFTNVLPDLGDLPPVTPAVAVGFTLPFLLITLVTSVLPAAEDSLAGMRAELTRANEDLARAVTRARTLQDHERRLFARHLHATVQAAVNAASLAIERATVDGAVDADVVVRAGSTIDAAVARLLDPASDADATGSDGGRAAGAADLDDRLAAIVATWQDLAVVELRLDDTSRRHLSGDAASRATLCDVVAEACANAVIHGHATRVTATVRAHAPGEDVALTASDAPTAPDTPRMLDLTVVDDGTATHPARQDGLGSRILAASCTRWELEHRADGTTLHATLPLR